jgi:hypothetical protein
LYNKNRIPFLIPFIVASIAFIMIVPVSAYGALTPGGGERQRITIVNNTGRTLIFQSSDHSHGSWGCPSIVRVTSHDPPQQIPPGGTITICSSTSNFGFLTGTEGTIEYAAEDCDGSLSLFRIYWSVAFVREWQLGGDVNHRIDNISHDNRYQVRHFWSDSDTQTYVISGGPAGPCPLRPGQVQPVPVTPTCIRMVNGVCEVQPAGPPRPGGSSTVVTPTCIRMVNGVCEVQPAGPPSSSVQGRPPDTPSNRTAGVFGRPDTMPPAPPLPPPGLSSQERSGYVDGCNQARSDSMRHSMFNPIVPNASTYTSSYREGYGAGYRACWTPPPPPPPTMSSGGGSRPSGMTVQNKNNTGFPLQPAGLNGTSGPGSSKPCIIDAMTGATICNSLTNSTVPFASINSSTAADLTGTSGGAGSSGSNDHHQSQHPAATRSGGTGGSGSGGNGGSDNGGKGSGSGDINPGGK